MAAMVFCDLPTNEYSLAIPAPTLSVPNVCYLFMMVLAETTILDSLKLHKDIRPANGVNLQ